MVKFNDENEIIKEDECRAILVGVQIDEDISYYMKELWGLAEAVGIVVLGEMVQNKEKPNSATFIGKGKVDELLELCENMEADTVIFNNELSGMQIRNLEERLGLRVIDRTILILDIFAKRAVSREGKLQVELAQLQYRLPRLIGFGKSLSRLGGGIGTRGPGEKKLETDRRHISKRMDDIKKELKEIKNNRGVQRARREKSEIPVVALVGYTNSGKSAIMNKFLQMTEKDEKVVFEENMLFATLDTSHRKIKLDKNYEFILADTVGFVSKLPHALIKAFKSTLEEVVYADLLLHIVDSSYENNNFHIEVTNSVLKEIGADDKEKIIVYNKMDLLSNEDCISLCGGKNICISAKRGDNMELLIDVIKEKLFSDRVSVNMLIPFDRGDISSYLCNKCKVIFMDYEENGTKFKVELSKADFNRLNHFIVKNNKGGQDQ
ncbi:GTPase HflX [Anaerovorax odorimutans]|uniref:GTPase HflX n=1 Tax=Anaerovorax odorimutans TaxID=109327 RepID=UPI0004146A87|nr:GTPase HflX [Anaerovorax odorimutans]